MSAFHMVHYPSDFICGLTEDDCVDLVDIDWVEFIECKISFWHPYIFERRGYLSWFIG
jgi:hypothetical protein